MKLGISYNLFDGEELLPFSVRAVRPAAFHINVVFQRVSNYGEHAAPGAEEMLLTLKGQGLIDSIIYYEPDLKKKPHVNETRKRDAGLQAAKKAGCTHFLNMDTDEFYETDKLLECIKKIEAEKPGCTAARIASYIKEPVYRIEGTREAFVSFICRLDFLSAVRYRAFFPVLVDPTRRFSGFKKFRLFGADEIVMHHMGLVRRDLEKKFRNSTANTANKEGLEQLKKHTLEWEYGKKFRYRDGSPELDVEKTENIFGISWDKNAGS